MTAPFFPQEVTLGDYTSVARITGTGSFASAGTGYATGNTVRPTGGTPLGTDTIFTVGAVSGGAIVNFSALTAGYYTVAGLPPVFGNVFTTLTGVGSGFTTSLPTTEPWLFAASPTLGANLGASISQLTVSAWWCIGASSTVSLAAGPDGSGVTFPVMIETTLVSTTSTTATCLVHVLLYSNATGGAVQLLSGVWGGTVPTYNQDIGPDNYQSHVLNLLMSFNTATQSIDILVNRAALTLLSGGWVGGAGAITNTATNWTIYGGSGGFADGSFFGAADVWIKPVHVDLTGANKDDWINADLTGVALPSNGATASGGVPVVFLHALSSGTADDFLANGGTGGAWDVYDSTITNLIAGALPAVAPIPLINDNCVTITPLAPGVPDPFCGVVHDVSTFTAAWTPTGVAADSYTLEWRKVGDVAFTTVTDILTTSYLITGLQSATEYEFQVEAINSGLESGFSALQTCATNAPVPPQPQSLHRYRGLVGINYQGLALVGDAYAGVVGKLNFNTFTEFGNPMLALITSPPIHDDRRRIFLKRFELDVESGVGLTEGQGSDPVWMLDWSKDGGRTWSEQQIFRSMGRIGAYLTRLRWLRLGQSRQWVLRLQSTDPVRRVIIGTYVDVEKGMG